MWCRMLLIPALDKYAGSYMDTFNNLSVVERKRKMIIWPMCLVDVLFFF